MGYFPFFVDIRNKKCIITGGGKETLLKIEKLLPYDVHICVIADNICEEIKSIKEIEILERKLLREDIAEDIDFCIIADVDREIALDNINLVKECNVPINVVDNLECSDFIFPSLIKRGELTVAVSTSGKNPSVASEIRRRIEEILPAELGLTLDRLNYIREEMKNENYTSDKIREVMHEMIEKAFNNVANEE